MEHRRQHKLLMLLALFVSIVSLSVGFAAFSTTLNISSNASVNPNSSEFSVKFSTSSDILNVGHVRPSINYNNLTATNGTINNTTNPTLSNLSTTFTKVGQYIEYKLYAINTGKYKAYLNAINFIGETKCEAVGNTSETLVSDACDSIRIAVYINSSRYENTTEITGHVLEKSSSDCIKVRIEYGPSGIMADGPFTVSFPEVSLIYSTIEQPGYTPTIMGSDDVSGTLNSKIKVLATQTDENINFSFNGWDGNSGVFIRKGTENQVNPIYYYRGEVDNNNVLFAGKCWKIVRTTETGGIKLIYNGIPTADNKCNGDNSLIGYSAYNDNNQTIEDVSYIHSDGTNSTIKQAIDTWYSSNLVSYTDWLEDTVWCNDQTITFEGYHAPMNMNVTFFDDYARNIQSHKPLLHCPTEYSLTTSSTQISNKLTYPVGLLTADELTLAGMGRLNYKDTGYLNNNEYWWGMSPFYFTNDFAVIFLGGVDGMLSGGGVYVEYGVRPAISLKAGTTVTSGDGTSSKPYIIE